MWRAHTDAGQTGALKILLEPESPYARAMSQERRREDQTRLRREGQALADLQHPNILGLVEVIDDDVLAVVTELVQGPNLAEWMARGPWPSKTLAAVFDGILDGVQAAHEAGWVHRDLKPGNVLVDLDDPPTAKVADFGLAHLSTATRLTRSGTVMGTPSYMAPEQVKDPSRVEPTADIFALGAILYELWCDRPPFQGPDVATTLHQASAGLYADPTALRPDLPAEVAAAIAGALDPDPASRIPDALTLRQVAHGERTWARPQQANVPSTLVIPAQRQRRWWPWITGLTSTAVIVGFLGAWWSMPSDSRPRRPQISDDPALQDRFDRAWTLWRNAELDAAAAVLEPVVLAEPGQGWVSLLDAIVAGSRRHEEDALAALESANPPTDEEGQALLNALRSDYRGMKPQVWSTLADAHPDSAAIQAVACVQLDAVPAATRVCRRATAEDDFALVHYLRARTSLLAGDLQTTDDHLNTLFSIHPDHAPGLTLRTAWMQAMGRWDDAVAHAEQALVLAPELPNARLARASARLNAGDQTGADQDYAEAKAGDSLRGSGAVLAISAEAQVRLGLGEVTRPQELLQQASDLAEVDERWGDVIYAQTRLGWFSWYLRDAQGLQHTQHVLSRAAAALDPNTPHAQELEAHRTYLSGLEAIVRADASAVNEARQHLQRLDVAVVATVERETAVAVLLAYEMALNGDNDRLLHIATSWDSCEAYADGGLLLQAYGRPLDATERFKTALARCTHSGLDRFFRFIAAQGMAHDAALRGDAEAEDRYKREMSRTWPNPAPHHPRASATVTFAP